MSQHEFFLFSVNYNALPISWNTGSSDTCFFADCFSRYKNKLVHSEHFSGTLGSTNIICFMDNIYTNKSLVCLSCILFV